VNIFVTNESPIQSARDLCDKHVPKMLLESCQMMSNIFHTDPKFSPPYRKLMIKHPCSAWVLKSKGNYEWLLNHTREILNQYKIRYNKEHKCENALEYCERHYNGIDWKVTDRTEHVLVMPLIYRTGDVINSYRSYIKAGKPFAKWSKGTDKPEWYDNHVVKLNDQHVTDYMNRGIPLPII
jgi:hypothetical protein